KTGVRISTIHALAAQIVRSHPDTVGLDSEFSIFDSDEQLQLARSAAEQAAVEIDPVELARRIGTAKANLEDAALWKVNGESAMAEAFDIYESELLAANALDFEGLVRAAARVLSKESIAEGWRTNIKALLVDEFHDVSEAQFALVRLLVPGGVGLTVVGDDDQIVYAFRGADPEYMVDFEGYFPGAQAIELRRNYRSHAGIVDCALGLIGHNEQRRPKQLVAAQGEGPAPTYEHFESEEQEAEAIAAWAEGHIATGNRASDLGVLVRMRNLRVRQDLEIALATRGIPYVTLGERALWDRSEVRDALAWLYLTVNPAHPVAFGRALESRPGLGPAASRSLLEAAKQRRVSYEAICLEPEEAGVGGKRAAAAIGFAESMAAIRREVAEPKGEFKDQVGKIIVISQIPDRLCQKGKAGRSQLASVRELFRAARAYQRHCEADGASPGLAEFLQELSLHSEDSRCREDAVILGTVHAVKGLEFRHVWLAGMEEGVMPSTRSLQEGRLEEERRLCYVALTRAREGLVISSCARRWGKPTKTSRFVSESGL
ncbi:MAG TPA: ATP-dependent helicase, partial [Solirubrobacterales bacterium]